jgi:hypothetical protein
MDADLCAKGPITRFGRTPSTDDERLFNATGKYQSLPRAVFVNSLVSRFHDQRAKAIAGKNDGGFANGPGSDDVV